MLKLEDLATDTEGHARLEPKYSIRGTKEKGGETGNVSNVCVDSEIVIRGLMMLSPGGTFQNVMRLKYCYIAKAALKKFLDTKSCLEKEPRQYDMVILMFGLY